MTIGAWKSYYELEDSLTLNELVELYGSLVEEENEKFKRDASLQGIDLEKGAKNKSSNQDSGMADRFRQHVAKKKAKDGKPASEAGTSVPGTGYMQI